MAGNGFPRVVRHFPTTPYSLFIFIPLSISPSLIPIYFSLNHSILDSSPCLYPSPSSIPYSPLSYPCLHPLIPSSLSPFSPVSHPLYSSPPFPYHFYHLPPTLYYINHWSMGGGLGSFNGLAFSHSITQGSSLLCNRLSLCQFPQTPKPRFWPFQ